MKNLNIKDRILNFLELVNDEDYKYYEEIKIEQSKLTEKIIVIKQKQENKVIINLIQKGEKYPIIIQQTIEPPLNVDVKRVEKLIFKEIEKTNNAQKVIFEIYTKLINEYYLEKICEINENENCKTIKLIGIIIS